MTKRLNTVCSQLTKSRVFADIGCDHGYCTQYMFQNGLCERAYISDISAGSLRKAATLLKREIEEGRCIPVVADGLEGIKEPCDLILIAGMGGEEIVRILERHPLPEKFVLQPMKNSEKVRTFLLGRGAKITRDYTFEDDKFYDLIVGTNEGGDSYSDFELRYGRDNLKAPSAAFIGKLNHDKNRLAEALSRPEMGHIKREQVREKYREIEVILHAIEGDL